MIIGVVNSEMSQKMSQLPGSISHIACSCVEFCAVCTFYICFHITY